VVCGNVRENGEKYGQMVMFRTARNFHQAATFSLSKVLSGNFCLGRSCNLSWHGFLKGRAGAGDWLPNLTMEEGVVPWAGR
jgi:hypothetical protein